MALIATQNDNFIRAKLSLLDPVYSNQVLQAHVGASLT